jgi:hypothetical protein
MIERRRNRSHVPGEALRLYFQALVDRHGLRALALANEDGLLIGGGGDEALDLAWVGALGCVCALGDRRGPSLSALVERVTGGHHLHSSEIAIRGERLYLAAVGGRVPAREDLAGALDRILASSLPAIA